MNGIINLNKPEGMTSHKAVSIARKLFGIKKIGHTGTLDPMVSGVLPLCIGAATRLTEYMDGDYKVYEGEMTLGLRTDTQDIWGTVLQEDKTVADKFTEKEITDALMRFEGEIFQTPPSFSAVRVGGRRLYEYARSGESVQVKPRRVHIRKIEVRGIESSKIRFLVECSKGTYIRTICADAGEILGCGAAMSALTRTRSGRFTIEAAMTIEELEQEINNLTLRMLPMDFPLEGYDMMRILKREDAINFGNGGFLEAGQIRIEKSENPSAGTAGAFFRVYYQNVFIGMAEFHQGTGMIKAHKIFCKEGL